MNLLSFLISTGINILSAPFLPDGRNEEGVIRTERNTDMEPTPFSSFGRSDSDPCATVTMKFGVNHIKLTTIPKGFCTNCCQVKMSRDVRFVLYNSDHPQDGVRINPFNEAGAARRAGVNPEWNTIIFIHGFSEPSPGQSGRAIIDAYLSRKENYNIILLDWGDLASFPWYLTAVHNVKLIGKILGGFIKLFNQTGEIPIKRLHLIGFSLGSHIASMAGKELQGKVRIPRITALDPAFPEFPLQDRTKRLANTDADYIDVIHTDSGVLGFPLSIGHADFYPNGGRALQPGCQPSYLAQQQIIEQVWACSHVRAWRLYAESVKNPEAFPTTQCEKWRGPNKECNFTMDAYMGFGNKNGTGQFYLRTGFKPPYGLKMDRQMS